MLTEKQLAKIATNAIRDIFGAEYLRNNRTGSILGHGMVDDDTFMVFIGIKDKNDLPKHMANPKGWTVYADVRINANTGDIIHKEYLLE